VEQDFRVPLVRERLGGFRLVVPVASPKGGVGKTTVSVGLSLGLARAGVPTSLLDSDFTNPTTHVMLGVEVESVTPREERGVLPVGVEPNLEFMSIAFYSKDRALPLRGRESVEALRELLVVTRWGGRVLVVDTPPGLSDTLLEILRLCRGARVLVVSTCDRMSIVSTRRILDFLRQEGVETLGVVANMCSSSDEVKAFIGVEPVGCLPFLEELPRIEGDRGSLAKALLPSLGGVVERVRSLLESGARSSPRRLP
jgi:ATP-binding protein involved in chromosome partitioning